MFAPRPWGTDEACGGGRCEDECVDRTRSGGCCPPNAFYDRVCCCSESTASRNNSTGGCDPRSSNC